MPVAEPIAGGRSVFCPHCGALYSVTSSRRASGGRTTAECVVCARTMDRWDTSESRTYKLIQRPEES
jgi:transcription elongation factor Elf1